MSKVERQAMGANGRKYIVEKCNYQKLLHPVRQWIFAGAEKAADAGIKVQTGGFIAHLRSGWIYLRKNGFQKFIKKLKQRI